MEENNQTISEFEIKLAQFSDLPNDVEILKDVSSILKSHLCQICALVIMFLILNGFKFQYNS